MPKTISAGKTPVVEIEMVGGDLSVVGWDGDDILLKADEDELRVEQQGERVKVSCDDDLSLRLPRAAKILVNNVAGDMSLRSVMGGFGFDRWCSCRFQPARCKGKFERQNGEWRCLHS